MAIKLSSLLDLDLIKLPLQGQEKWEILHELSELIAKADPAVSQRNILHALAEREKQGPFSMGRGVAYPHARTEAIRSFTIALGTCPNGIDFKAPDGEKIYVVMLFVIPHRHSNLYLHAMAGFLNFFSTQHRVREIALASRPQDVIALFDSADTAYKGSAHVKDIMRISPTALRPDSSIQQVWDSFLRLELDTLPVIDQDGTFMGEVRLSQLVQLLSSKTSGLILDPFTPHATLPLKQLLPGKLEARLTLLDEDTLEVAMLKMAKAGQDRAYVLRDGKLIGILYLRELMKHIHKTG